MEALGINLGYLLVYLCSFGVILVVLRAWVYQPLVEMLEKRRQTISQGLEDARVAADLRSNTEQEAEQVLAQAQARAAEIVHDATLRAEKAEEEIRAEAEADVARSRAAALAELEGERDRMLAELRGQVATLAIAAAHKLIEENLDERRQRRLVEEFFSGVSDGRVVVLDEVDRLNGNQADVTSALPLTLAEQQSVSQGILSRMGNQATVNFRVDPAILGGLVVRVGDRVIDGSLATRLEEMHHNLR